eukprot:TRINITY_DN3403_c0_g2_i1.p1 TRINITY_DN3403_c0_g2~~TRINITY_DN3403_c0_g2_i1.p1  ORF type:complete len:319 (-),score=16.88 TRINITY_DN3403_c0_g2_i1:87-1043(-)
MGVCCGSERKGGEPNLPRVKLENYNRWGMLSFAFQKTPYLCVYDFQESHPQFAIPNFSIPLAEYSCIYKMPLIFVAGGVDKSTDSVTSKVWAASLNEGILNFSEFTSMNCARRKPFLLSPIEGVIFAIAGYYHPTYPMSVLQSCEKYHEGEGRWEQIATLNHPPSSAFAVSEYIYTFGTLEDLGTFERLNAKAVGAEWEVFSITSDLPEIDLAEGFSVTCSKDVPDLLYIFGGVDQAGKPSRTVYSIKVRNGTLLKESKSLNEDVVATECCTDSEDYSYHITKDLRVCVFCKDSEKWKFYNTIIKEKAEEKGINVIFQ